MMICDVVKELPLIERGKYTDLRRRISDLSDEEWLPVECDSKEEIVLVRQAIRGSHAKTRSVGLRLYISKRPL